MRHCGPEARRLLSRSIAGDSLFGVYIRRTPHPVIVTIRDNRDHIRVLLYSYHTTIAGWGVLLKYTGDV